MVSDITKRNPLGLKKGDILQVIRDNSFGVKLIQGEEYKISSVTEHHYYYISDIGDITRWTKRRNILTRYFTIIYKNNSILDKFKKHIEEDIQDV